MKRLLEFVKKDWYVQGYKTYNKLSAQREINVAYLHSHIPRALQQLQLPRNKPRFNILSVGAGQGETDFEILKAVQGYLNAEKQLQEVEIMNTAVEPHRMMIEQYKEFISGRPVEEKAVFEFDLKPITFEEYAKTEHEPNQYDMIQAIHSLYFVEDLEAALNHCYWNELGEKGLIATFFIDSDFLIHDVAEITNKSREEENWLTYRTSADVVAVAENFDWNFERVYCPILIDVTGILRSNSDEGNLLLDFLTYTKAFRQSTDQELVDNVLELLEERSFEDKNGNLMIKAANEMIFIYKCRL